MNVILRRFERGFKDNVDSHRFDDDPVEWFKIVVKKIASTHQVDQSLKESLKETLTEILTKTFGKTSVPELAGFFVETKELVDFLKEYNSLKTVFIGSGITQSNLLFMNMYYEILINHPFISTIKTIQRRKVERVQEKISPRSFNIESLKRFSNVVESSYKDNFVTKIIDQKYIFRLCNDYLLQRKIDCEFTTTFFVHYMFYFFLKVGTKINYKYRHTELLEAYLIELGLRFGGEGGESHTLMENRTLVIQSFFNLQDEKKYMRSTMSAFDQMSVVFNIKDPKEMDVLKRLVVCFKEFLEKKDEKDKQEKNTHNFMRSILLFTRILDPTAERKVASDKRWKSEFVSTFIPMVI
ncbi:MAG: hypothetical protein ACTSUE_16720 [Promethearchaeota archaeon]